MRVIYRISIQRYKTLDISKASEYFTSYAAAMKLQAHVEKSISCLLVKSVNDSRKSYICHMNFTMLVTDFLTQ